MLLDLAITVIYLFNINKKYCIWLSFRCPSFTNHTHPLLKGKGSVTSQTFKFVKFRGGSICCHIKKGHGEKRPLAKNQPVCEN